MIRIYAYSLFVWLCAGAISGDVTSGQAAAAGGIVDVGGFEGFDLGPLEGQHGWVASGGLAGMANVQSTVVKSGTKALRVDRAANVDNRWADPLSSVFPSNRFILVTWDMRVTGTGSTNGGFGPFFGVEAYDDQGPPVPGLLGSLGVDATTGDVLYQRQDDGILIETGVDVAFDQWNQYALLFDFDLDRYTAFLNGQSLATTGFVDRGFGLNQITDADISAIAAGADPASQSMTGSAYFDNFLVSDGIPGDFDFDGDVDSADLATWKTASAGGTASGDADGDGDSDGADFLVWQRNLGLDFVPATAAVRAVPEPSTVALVGAGTLAVMASLRRRVRRLI